MAPVNAKKNKKSNGKRRHNNMRCAAVSLLVGLFTLVFQDRLGSETKLGLSIYLPQFNTTLSTKETKNTKTVSLVVSFFAAGEQEKHHPHRAEIEAALLANLDNPHLDQVAVILDSTAPGKGCEQFVVRMKTLLQRHGIDNNNKLTCIDRLEGQPNYFEMFQFTLQRPEIRGEIIILSNADMAFDDTLARVQRLQPHALLTLSTQGYNPKLVPSRLREIYRHRMDLTFTEDEGHTLPWCEFTPANPWSSWDTYIYHKSFLALAQWTPQDFTRPTFAKRMAPFYMNQMGAELAAVATLKDKLTHKNNGTVPVFWNACGLIHIWHFHLQDKMHKADAKFIWPPMKEQANQNEPSAKVPAPWHAFPKCCDEIHQCPNAFVTSDPQKAADPQAEPDASCHTTTGKRLSSG